MSGPSWYDVLGVEPDASTEEIRASWREQIADLEPGHRRFRLLNEAAEVLLDPERRAAHDAELTPVPAPAATAPEAAADPEPAAAPASDTASDTASDAAGDKQKAAARGLWLVPGWLLTLVGVLAVAAVVLASAATLQSDPERDVSAARSAAERAVVPVLSYDYRTLEEDVAAAQAYMTSDFRDQYDQMVAGILDGNAESRKAVVQTEVVDSAVVRTGQDRVDVLLFVDRPTTNADDTEPIVYKDQVTLQMRRVDGEWLVADLVTSPIQS